MICECFEKGERHDRCRGTREKDWCSCGGDESKCDFYGHVRERANDGRSNISELKSCPFCGEKPHLDRHEIFCDCGVKVDIPAWDNGENDFPSYEEAVQEMVGIWNKRYVDIKKGDYVVVYRNGVYDHRGFVTEAKDDTFTVLGSNTSK